MPPPDRGLAGALLGWLAEPRLRNADVDSGSFVELHRQILLEKPVIRGVFREFYQCLLEADRRWLSAPGARVELGAGSSLFAELFPGVISTDIKLASTLDAVVDAQSLPFRKNAVRACYGINCFHHFPDPARFFDELTALLPVGGGCLLIEPYYGPVAAFLYRRLFATERFDRAEPGWRSEGTGPMTGANQALSYIVFTRDFAEFSARYPELEIVQRAPLRNYLRYVLSGGLNFRSLLPAALAPAARRAKLCCPRWPDGSRFITSSSCASAGQGEPLPPRGSETPWLMA